MKHFSLGVDVGGTFTDFVLLDEKSGRISIGKVLTTPTDPSDAMVAGSRDVLAQAEVSGERLSRVVHGTTLVTNTIIERKGAKTGLITTSGFRDTLEIGRCDFLAREEAPDAREDRRARISGCSEQLAGGDLARRAVVEHEIRKGAADVDRELETLRRHRAEGTSC